MTQILDKETANKIIKVFGANTQIGSMDVSSLSENFDTYLSDRNFEGTIEEFINLNLQAEVIKAEERISDKKARGKFVTNLRNRVRALKLPKSINSDIKRIGAERKAKAQKPATAANGNGKAKAAQQTGPQVGDEGLKTEADFTSPAHPELKDYVYHAMLDKQGRVVGRGFLARVGSAPKRRWFALRNEEQTKLWQTSNWDIRQIDFATYQKLTLAYFEKNGWVEWKSLQAEMKQAGKPQTPPPAPNQSVQESQPSQ